MADLSISTGLPAAIGRPVGDGGKTLALRAAQKAFFDAALGQATIAAPTVPVVSIIPVTRAQPSAGSSGGSAEGKPTRPLRPGSLLDIRV